MEEGLKGLGWEDFGKSLAGHDGYSLLKFVKYVESTDFTAIQKLDFSGIDQLTDVVFHVLNVKAQNDGDVFNEVKVLVCAGCIHLTDYAVDLMSTTFPNLEKINLDGCHQLTQKSIYYLSRNCSELKTVTMKGTSVCNVPTGTGAVTYDLRGCPLYNPLKELVGPILHDTAWKKVPEYKVVVISNSNCQYSIREFLHRNIEKLGADASKFSYEEGSSFNTTTGPCVLNIFECHSAGVDISPFISDKAMYLVAVDMVKAEDAIVELSSMLNYIKGQVEHTNVIVLALYTEDMRVQMDQKIRNLGSNFTSTLSQQQETMKQHLLQESYVNPKVKVLNFADQIRYSRCLRAVKAEHSFRLLKVNVDTMQVQFWAEAMSGNPPESEEIRKLEEEKFKLEDLIKQWQTDDYVKMLETLDNLDASSITQLKSMKEPSEVVTRVVEAICILKGVQDTSWLSFTEVLNTTFVQSLKDYDSYIITHEILEELKPCMNDESITEQNCDQTAAAALLVVVQTMYKYGGITAQLKDNAESLSRATYGQASGWLTVATLEEDIVKERKKLAEAMEGWSKAWTSRDKAVLAGITKKDLTELKRLNNPPEVVRLVFEATCILLHVKDLSWTTIKAQFSADLITKLKNFDKDSITKEDMDRLEPYMNAPNLTGPLVRRTSNAATGILMWVHSMHSYGRMVLPHVTQLNSKMRDLQTAREQTKTETRGRAVPLDVLEKEVEQEKKEVEEIVNTWYTTEWETARSQLNSMNKSDLSELKSFARPPDLVLKIGLALCILFHTKERNWKTVKVQLLNVSFIRDLQEYDKDSVTEAELKALDKHLQDPNLTVEALRKISTGGAVLLAWVKAIYAYAKNVAPRIAQIRQKMKDLEDARKEAEAKPADGAEPWVYISCHPSDTVIVQKIHKSLEDAGYSIWVKGPHKEFGDGQTEAHFSAVQKAAVVILAMSTPYEKSADCKAVVEHAMKHQKDMVAVRLEADFTPSEWLKKAMGSQLLISFCENKSTKTSPYVRDLGMKTKSSSGDYVYNTRIQTLIKELGSRGMKSADSTQSINLLMMLEHSIQLMESTMYRETAVKFSQQFCDILFAVTRPLRAMKICGVGDIMAAVDYSLGDNKETYVKALERIHMMGKVLFWSDMPGQPVVTDIAWFMQLLNTLTGLSSREDLLNVLTTSDRKVSALGPDVALIKRADLQQAVGDLATQEQVLVIVKVLKHFGILIDVPEVPSIYQPENDTMFLFSSLHDKAYVTKSPLDARYSSNELSTTIFPSVRNANYYNATDVQVCWSYKFTYSIPASLLPRVMAECCRLSQVVLMYHWGIICRQGAAEVFIKHNMHGTMMSSSLDVVACTTSGPSRKLDVVTQYLWTVMSTYLVVIDYYVNCYSLLPCKVHIPCQGPCKIEGYPHTYSPTELTPQLSPQLSCPRCGTEGMSPDQIALLTGRQRLLPFHDFVDAEDDQVRIETVPWALYGALIPQCWDQNMTLWACYHCGISKIGALRLWEMECAVYPSFGSSCLSKLVAMETVSEAGDTACVMDQIPLQGSCILHPSRSGTPEGGLYLCKTAFYVNGLMGIHLTVIETGPVTVMVAPEKYFRKDLQKDKSQQNCWLSLSLESGKISRLSDKSSSGTREVHVQTDGQLKCKCGDRLSIETIGAKFRKINDKERVIMLLAIKKNGHQILTEEVPYRSSLAISFDPVKAGPEPRLIVECPTFPTVTASHFPLGSALLYKTGLGSQWALGRVESHQDGLIRITDHQEKYAPDSEDLLPLGCFTSGLSVVLGNEMLRSKAQLQDYLQKHNCSPTPFAVFTRLHGTKDNARLHLRDHEPCFCSVSQYSPQVLEEGYMSFMKRDGKSMKLQDYSWVMMPDFQAMPSVIVQPVRHNVHNWDKQDCHYICRGNNIQNSTIAERDAHFVDVARVMSLSSQNINTMCMLTCKELLFWYHCLLKHKNIIPSWENILAGEMFKDLKMEQVVRSLKEIIRLYKATLLLFDKCWTIALTPADKKSVALMSAELSKLRPQVIEDKLSRCDTHTNMFNKKTFKELDVGLHPSSISYIKMSHVNIRKQFLDLLGALPNLENIDLHACNIPSLEGVHCCPNLQSLFLSGNHLKEIHKDVLKLKGTLQQLDVSNNPMDELPDFLCQLTQLRFLAAGNTHITKLPEDIGDLKFLDTLILTNSLMVKLPDSFQKLKHLHILRLTGVPWPGGTDRQVNILTRDTFLIWCKQAARPISQVPQEELETMFAQADANGSGSLDTEELAKLDMLFFQRFPRIGRDSGEDSQYGGMPPQIFSCNRLRTLALCNQSISSVPDQIGSLTKLSFFHLNHNKELESISAQAGRLPLKVLTLPGCPKLHTPPKEIRSQGMATTLAFIKRLSTGSVSSYRTKLMFVGLGGAGKTSLMRALMSKDMKAPDIREEAITDGIDISMWSVDKKGVTLTYSVWDFAGQTVYYNTHQFFMSNRAVYFLIWNMRQGYEHSGMEFWLSSVRCHAPKAPIFVVGTHCDKVSKTEVPMEGLQKRFPTIAGFFSVSSLTGYGVAELLEELTSVTLKQPYIGERIPEAWLNLEKDIQGKRNDNSLLDWKTVSSLATKAGIYGAELNQAVQFLHDMGTLQHFTNQLLRDRVVINPQWIVDVMACVVSVHNDVIKDGRLKHKDIPVIWKDYPKDLHSWLLRLTEVFDLTFPLRDQKVNIVPCLLHQKQPQIKWPNVQDQAGAKEIKMEYFFEYLPVGLFNRAQVRLYQFSDDSCIWKSGSLLNKNGHLALFEQVSDTCLMVKVYGTQPENVLLLVHEVLEGLIAESFQGVKYEYKMPCPDCVKENAKDPTMFSSKVLRRAIEMKAMFLQCHTFFHVLSITDVQGAMPPDSSSDYNLQIKNAVRGLEDLHDHLRSDVFFLHCPSNIPSKTEEESMVHPSKIRDDLQRNDFRCWFAEDVGSKNMEDLANRMKNSKVILVLVSSEFVQDELCKRMFHHARDILRKDLVVLMVGEGREWQKSDIGMLLLDQVYVNFQRKEQYSEKLQELKSRLQQKLKGSKNNVTDVFISYAWSNSASAVKAGHAREKDGSLGFGDPREIKTFLEGHGITCWLDIEQTGRLGLFEDISKGIRQSKVMIACVSDEYACSTNCQMEFRFAHVVMRMPIILAVVGTGFMWESTEIGMLSLGYPKTNFQVANNIAQDTLLQNVKEKLLAQEEAEAAREQHVDATGSSSKENAFKELYEMAQRKLLRQLISYSENDDPYPRLFVADLNYDPDSGLDTKGDAEADQIEVNLSEESNQAGRKKYTLGDLRDGQFCIKMLCENEGGWHTVDNGIPVNLSGPDLASLWKLSAAYMAPILAILKYSTINLHIVNSDEGAKLFKISEKYASVDADMRPVYMALRQYIMFKDENHTRGGLSRCHLPSGKVLWLCAEHRKMDGVSLLEDPVDSTMDLSEDFNPDFALLRQLREIADKRASTQDEAGGDTGLETVPLTKAVSSATGPTQTTRDATTPIHAAQGPLSKASLSTVGNQGTEPGEQGTRQTGNSLVPSGGSSRPPSIASRRESNASRREGSNASLRRRPDSRSSKASSYEGRPTSRACILQ